MDMHAANLKVYQKYCLDDLKIGQLGGRSSLDIYINTHIYVLYGILKISLRHVVNYEVCFMSIRSFNKIYVFNNREYTFLIWMQYLPYKEDNFP